MRLKWGWWWWWGCKLGGRALPTIFPMQYTMQSRALAGRRQLSPLRLLSLPLSFPSFPSYFSSSVSHNHCVRLLFPLAFHHPTFFSSFSYYSSCCPFCACCHEKQTDTFGNDPVQTSAQWHHNKSRNFPSITLSAG